MGVGHIYPGYRMALAARICRKTKATGIHMVFCTVLNNPTELKTDRVCKFDCCGQSEGAESMHICSVLAYPLCVLNN